MDQFDSAPTQPPEDDLELDLDAEPIAKSAEKKQAAAQLERTESVQFLFFQQAGDRLNTMTEQESDDLWKQCEQSVARARATLDNISNPHVQKLLAAARKRNR